MEVKTKEEIIQRRKEIEQEIIDLLKENQSDFSLQDVKNIIYNEQDQNDLAKALKMFDNGLDASGLSNVLETINDAWNYFPHKVLGGLSPAEKILEYHLSKN